MSKWIVIGFTGLLIIAYSLPDRKQSDPKPAKPLELTLDDEARDYRVECRLRLKREARYSSKAVINYVEALKAPKAPDVWFAKGMAELMNDYGAMIPHTFMCKFQNKVLVEFAAAPGSH